MIGFTTIFGFLILAVIAIIIFKNVRQKGLDLLSLGMMVVVIVLLFMIGFPNETNEIAKSVGFFRSEIAFLSIVSITALIVSIKNYFKNKTQEKEITELTRKIALESKKK